MCRRKEEEEEEEAVLLGMVMYDPWRSAGEDHGMASWHHGKITSGPGRRE